MFLVGQANQMGQNTRLASVGLYLAEHYIGGMQRSGDGAQITLVAREPQDLRVPDYIEPALTLGGELLNDIIGQCVAEERHAGVRGLVVKPEHGESWRIL